MVINEAWVTTRVAKILTPCVGHGCLVTHRGRKKLGDSQLNPGCPRDEGEGDGSCRVNPRTFSTFCRVMVSQRVHSTGSLESRGEFQRVMSPCADDDRMLASCHGKFLTSRVNDTKAMTEASPGDQGRLPLHAWYSGAHMEAPQTQRPQVGPVLSYTPGIHGQGVPGAPTQEAARKALPKGP